MEQVVSSAPQVALVLKGTSQSRVLATSQVPLRIQGEQRYVLGPLEGEDVGVRLFAERARAVAPEYDGDPRAVAELVDYFDGLPLAIELVAARANLFGPEEMLERIRADRMSYRPSNEAPRRHRSLDDALEWSHSLLDEDTRQLLERLGVFAGSMTVEAAEQVGQMPDGGNPLNEIAELLDRSLLLRSAERADRIRMLDSVRRFARARLEQSGARDEVEARFVGLFQELCRDAHDGLQGDRGEWWRDLFDDDLENIREVLAILERDGRPGDGLEMLGNIWRFYQSRGRLGELELWLDRFFSLPGSREDAVGPVKGLMARAALRYWRREVEDAVEGYREAVDRARRVDDRRLLAEALYGLATSLVVARHEEGAVDPLEECRAIYSDLDDRNGLADVIAAEAFAALNARGLAGLGPKFREAMELYEAAGRRTQAAQALYAQAAVALVEGRHDDCRELALTGIRRGLEMNDIFLQIWGLEYVSRIALEEGDVERSGLLAGAAVAQSERIGGGWSPETIGLEDTAERLARELGADSASRLLEPGRRLTLQEAVALALGEGEPTHSG
jgi:non-specific serine/threonine protein kinase